MVQKSLDMKLARILADPSCGDFILADAKDADMGGGIGSPGKERDGQQRSLDDYRRIIRENVRHEQVDIMLMSASTSEVLTINERLFDASTVTPACRANDTTDIYSVRDGVYPSVASRPFRTAMIDHITHGRLNPAPSEPIVGADLALYSATFNNDLQRDLETLTHYRDFRVEAEVKGLRHFLEVFNPNACADMCPRDIGRYLNDMIARTLAGVAGKGRPIFLKIPYNGPEVMEELAGYDRTLVPGILGGASGTTYDAYFQLHDAREHGARVALYGRMINNSEHQGTMIEHLRRIADGELTDPAQAVRSYHAALERLNIKPYRNLEDDLQSTKRGTAYSVSSSTTVAVDGGRADAPMSSITNAAIPNHNDRVSQNLARLTRVLG